MSGDGLYVAEAVDLEPTEDSYDEPPLSEVTWPDGRVDALPHTCVEADITPADIGSPLLHLGHVNLAGGMTSGYYAADLARITADTYFARVGDVDESGEAVYVRGPLAAVSQHWLSMVDFGMMPLPWRAFLLANLLGLLDDVPDCDGGYGAPLFAETSDPLGPTNADLMFFRSTLSPAESAELVPEFNDSSAEWTQRAAKGESAATLAWQTRVESWTEWLDED